VLTILTTQISAPVDLDNLSPVEGLPESSVSDSQTPVKSSLREQLYSARKEAGKNSAKYFIPRNEINRLVTKDSILEVLRKDVKETHTATLSRMAENVFESAPKLFAILAACGMEHKIGDFLAEGISDKDLPFSKTRNSDIMKVFRTRTNGNTDQSFSHYSQRQFEIFCQVQWEYLAPFFGKADGAVPFHYELDDECILPFVDDTAVEKKIVGEGGYGRVWRVKIHPAHSKLFHTSPDVSQSSPLAVVLGLIVCSRKRRHMLSRR
jgi:hypothetical protein